MNRPRIAELALLGVVAAGALLLYAREASLASRRPLFQNEYRNMGLNLAANRILKDVSGPGPTARRLPLYPVFLSLVSRPGDRGVPAYAVQALLGFLCVLLTFTAGRRLGGPVAGLLAAAAVAFDPGIYGYYAALGVEALFIFAVLTAFNGVLEWADGPSRRTAIWAGLGIGATLLCRSVLLFLPPLLMGAAFWLHPRLRKTVGLLILCAYLPLAPWAVRNAILLKGFVPIESFVPATALYGASLGRIVFPDPWEAVSDAQKETGLDVYGMSDVDKNSLLTRLALKNIRRDLWGYALGSLKRFFIYWNYRLVFFLPALLWLIRRKPGAGPGLAALFAAYFSVHALIILDTPNGERYLSPALPILDCVAAAALAGLLGRGASAESRLPTAAKTIPAMCAAVLALLAASTYFSLAAEVWKYGVRAEPAPGEAAQIEDLEQEIRFFPREAKLYNDVGVLLLLNGRASEAVGSLGKAVELDPRSQEAAGNLAAARQAMSGRGP